MLCSRNQEIYRPDHSIEIINSVRDKLITQRITHKDIFEFTEGKAIKPFKLKFVKQYQNRKHQVNSWVKFQNDGLFQEFKINREINPNILATFEKQTKPNGISSARLATLKKLKASLPSKHQAFIDKLENNQCINDENISINN